MRTILITGATGGFGPTLARHFASKGDRLLLHGRNQDKLNKLALEINTEENYTFMANPLQSKTAAKDLYDSIKSRGVLPNIIIHHLGGTLGIKSALATQKHWESVLTLNFSFAAELNRLLVPEWLNIDNPVRIIHISSISAISLRGSAPYASSKALLNAYVVALGRELATSKIVVSGIMPGAFLTPGSNWDSHIRLNPDMVSDFLRHHHATNRLGNPVEILPAVDFLSDFANTFSQGCILNIDGGTM